MRILVGGQARTEDEQVLRSAYPDIDFVRVDAPEQMMALTAGVDATIGMNVTETFVRAAEGLRWVQIRPAGVNALPLALLAERGITLTNGRGVHNAPVAETALAMMLAFTSGLAALSAARDRRQWMFAQINADKRELGMQTVIVVGMGDIGRALAARLAALGSTVVGCDPLVTDPPPGVARMIAEGGLHAALAEADHVVLVLPLTPDTEGWMNETRLRAMKPTAHLFNVGRGPVVQREALMRALTEGWIAGAGLDVTVPEPIPPDDPLWDMPNVLLTHHTAGSSPHNDARIREVYVENVRRFAAGLPLLNIIDCQRGF